MRNYQRSIDQLLAVTAPRTIENTLRPFDDAQAELAAVGQQSSLLDSVHPEKEVRDKAQALTQKVSEIGTLLSLNQDVYKALSAIDLASADPATRHYLERTLLQYRLSGVDRDDETRAKIKGLQDKATEISLAFSRNVQEGAKHIKVTAADLEGLPDDYLKAHPPAEDGIITLSTDFPDMQPLMTYAKNAEVRRLMFLAYHTRAYPQNKELLLNLLKTRQELATILGYKSWADLATADQMMQSAERMQSFLNELEAASKSGAEREFAMVFDFARQQQPDLKEIDLAARGYWYEQYRRSAFQFDSQSVRPYFPYAQVEPGILRTAEKLFHVRFEQDKEAEVWHPSVTAWKVFDAGSDSQANRPLLSRYAPPRGQRQVVQRRPARPRHSRTPISRGRADLQLPRRQRWRPGPDAIQRCRDLLPRVRPPDARHPRRRSALGRHQRHPHRVGLRRSAFADARRVLPRPQAARQPSPATTKPARPSPPRSSSA